MTRPAFSVVSGVFYRPLPRALTLDVPGDPSAQDQVGFKVFCVSMVTGGTAFGVAILVPNLN